MNSVSYLIYRKVILYLKLLHNCDLVPFQWELRYLMWVEEPMCRRVQVRAQHDYLVNVNAGYT